MTPLGFGIAGALFQLRNAVSTQCLDSPVGEDAENKAITPYPCHEQGGNQLRNSGGGNRQCLDYQSHGGKKFGLYQCHMQGGNQYWMLSKDGEIRRDESCVDYAGQDVMIFPCHGMKGNQEWRYNHETGRLLHAVSQKCLEMSRDGAKLSMQTCKSDNTYQKWRFKEYNAEKAMEYGVQSPQ